MSVTAGSEPPVEAATGQLLSHLRSVLPGLAGALRQVGNVILEDPAWASRATIVELGERSGTSPATVTRFCRSIGLAGYTELRVGIATDIGRADQAGWEVGIGADVLPTDPVDRVLRTLLSVDLQAMHETAAGLDLRVVESVVDALVAARRVDLYGVGHIAPVLEEMQLRMHRIDIASWAWSDVHNGLMSAALLGPEDVAIAVSHSGRSTETVDMLAQARASGATTVAITNFSTSPIAEVADHLLGTSVRETSYRSGEMSARHSQFLVLDLLYLAAAQRTHERATQTWALAAGAVAPHRSPNEPRVRSRAAETPSGTAAHAARGGAR